jgi:putative resolvase
MRLSIYAKKMGVTYKTAHRWWKAGKLDAYQLDTGTVIVNDPPVPQEATGVALYSRVSSADQKDDLARQIQCLKDYAASRGYQVTKMVEEVASGLNDHRPKLTSLLADTSIGTIVVEHRDRLTRFGFNYIDQLMQCQGRHLEVIFPSDTDNELVDDFVSVITSMAARIYGQRNVKRRAKRIQQSVEAIVKNEANA